MAGYTTFYFQTLNERNPLARGTSDIWSRFTFSSLSNGMDMLSYYDALKVQNLSQKIVKISFNSMLKLSVKCPTSTLCRVVSKT